VSTDGVPHRPVPGNGAEQEARTPEQAVLTAAVSLARALRGAGLGASVDSELVFYRALAEVDVRHRASVHWAAHAAFVRAPDDRPAFEAMFERFWEGRELLPSAPLAEHGESDPRMGGPRHGGEALPQFRQGGKCSTPLDDGERSRATRDVPTAEGEDGSSNRQRGVLAAYSPAESFADPSRLEFAKDELLALRRLADEIKRSMPERCSRRLRPARSGGQLDVRRTVRASLGTDGEALRLAYCSPSNRPRRLLLLCDVSGSMERYSRVLLASLKAAVGALEKVEAFVFATRLTRLTRSLSGRDLDRALERSRECVPDWSGGTRIGKTLAEFNRGYGRRGFARGAIVIVVSDGWDRGDPDLLAQELRRLQLQARRLVWINPRPMIVDDQPLAIGMRAAMPFIDDFVPGHDPRALAGLACLIAQVGNRRPQRRHRAADPPPGDRWYRMAAPATVDARRRR
jgi:uncharacterized protein with von Willebrand factor type A (vWA) domain